jgi:hypothetical protein
LNPIKKFIIQGFFISLLLAVIGYYLFTGVLRQYYQFIFPFILLFIFLFTTIIHVILLKAARKELNKFTTWFLMLTGIKIIVYLLIMIVYLVISGKDAAPFLITFLFIYLVFTIFEVISILPQIKRIG